MEKIYPIMRVRSLIFLAFLLQVLIPNSVFSQNAKFEILEKKSNETPYLLNNQSSFGGQQVISTELNSAYTVYATDLDGDGDEDILAGGADYEEEILWFKNDGNGGFNKQPIYGNTSYHVSDILAIDLDGDNDRDILQSTWNQGLIVWYENDGEGNFGNHQIITKDAIFTKSIHATDLDGDGDADVLAAISHYDMIAWYENDGEGGFGDQQVITKLTDSPSSVFATDLDGDGDADVLSASRSDNKIAWYENDGEGSFGSQQVITTELEIPSFMYAADLDGDGDADVLTGSPSQNKIVWFENNGEGGFGNEKVITSEVDGIASVYAIDLNGDGDTDVLSASYSDDKIAWYENDGEGVFGKQQVITAAVDQGRSVFAIDLDGDGDADVISASNGDDKIAWYENLMGVEKVEIKTELLSNEESHPLLNDGMISPGEEIVLNVRFTNESNQDVQISNINLESDSPDILLERMDIYSTDGLGLSIPSGQSKAIGIPLRIVNWPNSGEKLNVDITWETADSSPYRSEDIAVFDTWLPDVHLDISEISNAIDQGIIGNESMISTSYVPYFKYESQKGLAGIIFAADLLLTTHGLVALKKDYAKEILKIWASTVLEGVYKESEKAKYTYLWGIAGTSAESGVSEDENLYVTNDPSAIINLPKMYEPVNAVVKVRKISEHINTDSNIPLTSNSFKEIPGYIIEPLSFVTDTLNNGGYLEASEAVEIKSDSDLLGQQLRVRGIVQQAWQGGDGYSYFVIAYFDDNPYSADEILIAGDALNVLRSGIHRWVIRTSDSDLVPSIGATIDLKGTYKVSGSPLWLPQPKYYIRSKVPLYNYIDIDSIDLISGSFENNLDVSKQFFNLAHDSSPVTLNFDDNNSPKQISTSSATITPDIHIYDGEGNHTGYVYDNSGQPEFIELDVPGTYSINRPSGQAILIDSLANRDFTLKTTSRSPGTYTLKANYVTLTDDDSLSQGSTNIFENLSMDSGKTLSQDFKTEQGTDGNLKVDSLSVRLSASRDTLALDWLDEPSAELSIEILSLSGSSELADISGESLTFADNFGPTESKYEAGTFHITLSGELMLEMLSSDVNKYQPISLDFSTNIGETYSTSIMSFVIESYPLVTSNEDQELRVSDYSISQNYPNPFNPTTNIIYSLPESSEVNISVYTMLGQKVTTLVNGNKPAGSHTITFDASNFSSGTYLIMLKAEEFTETRKMTLIK